jgi:hypothetical protein
VSIYLHTPAHPTDDLHAANQIDQFNVGPAPHVFARLTRSILLSPRVPRSLRTRVVVLILRWTLLRAVDKEIQHQCSTRYSDSQVSSTVISVEKIPAVVIATNLNCPGETQAGTLAVAEEHADE